MSSFLLPGSLTKDGQLASLHLSHNHSLPVLLSTVASTDDEKGYAEGVVTNTKFGSFPHSTLIDVPWGSQIRASIVDTGSRGRIPNFNGSKKRKADAISTNSSIMSNDFGSPRGQANQREATVASSGFIHVLPPTPENWTMSLPHRTQVVYTPDYSYILHRIRARPGSVLIEAGSGSGSFTHAAARAVFNGAGPMKSSLTNGKSDSPYDVKKQGRIFTYEFHPERHEKVQAEMHSHGLSEMVTATHRDVYTGGFLLEHEDGTHQSPLANAVFLDLPAPWEALQHLTRETNQSGQSALDPLNPVHICTFSPCIEQAQKTISSMRNYGWIEIEMVEVQHKRIDVRREFTGLKYDGMRSVNAFAADVDEAITKLKAIEQRARDFHGTSANDNIPLTSKKTAAQNAQIDAAKVFYQEGIIVHRSEPDLKTHTSYLVFAVLPRDWSEEDEENAKTMLKSNILTAPTAPKSQRQLKKEAKHRKKLTQGISQGVHRDEQS